MQETGSKPMVPVGSFQVAFASKVGQQGHPVNTQDFFLFFNKNSSLARRSFT
jgi:hypothetical protein